MLFSLIGFLKLQTCTIICELICNIIFTATPCIWCVIASSCDLGCDVDLPRSFVTLGGLLGLYKWKYVRVNVLNGDNRTWACMNWVVVSQESRPNWVLKTFQEISKSSVWLSKSWAIKQYYRANESGVTRFSMWKSSSNMTDLAAPTHVARQHDFIVLGVLKWWKGLEIFEKWVWLFLK